LRQAIVVDWREVERLRAKGLDWESIAESPKVAYTAPEGVTDSGRALKSLYLTRRSQRARGSRGAPAAAETEEAAATERSSNRARWLWTLGIVFALGFAIWSVFAFAFPGLIGALVPFFPWLLTGLVLGVILLGSAFIVGVTDVRAHLFRPVVIGVVVGLVASGVVGVVAYESGFQNWATSSPIEFEWNKAQNPLWTANGKPVILFIGSAACPYCSISSWAFLSALQAYGSASGYTTTSSNPNDVFANNPAVTLYSVNYASNYLSADIHEDPDNTSISVPSMPAKELSMFDAYDAGGSIPFIAVGGVYYYVGSLLTPATACIGGPGAVTTDGQDTQCANGPLSQSEFATQAGNSSTNIYGAIIQESWILQAVFWKALAMNGMTPPTSVQEDQNVAQIYKQLS
jgi:Domain of unknown function (DUF929)